MTPFTAEVPSIRRSPSPVLPDGAVHMQRTPLGARLTPAAWPAGATMFVPVRPAPAWPPAARRRAAAVRGRHAEPVAAPAAA